jgi:hypothetical protein
MALCCGPICGQTSQYDSGAPGSAGSPPDSAPSVDEAPAPAGRVYNSATRTDGASEGGGAGAGPAGVGATPPPIPTGAAWTPLTTHHASQYNSASGPAPAVLPPASAAPAASTGGGAPGDAHAPASAVGHDSREASGGGGGGGASGAVTATPPTPPGKGAAPLAPGHLLRHIRAKDLVLRGGAHLGAGAFGSVQPGEWGDVEVAVKSNSVSCLDVAAIAREREMYGGVGGCAPHIHSPSVIPVTVGTVCIHGSQGQACVTGVPPSLPHPQFRAAAVEPPRT